MDNTRISQKILVFHGRNAPEKGFLVGYGALIDFYQLPVPLPSDLALISSKNRKYTLSGWLVFGPKYMPAETLAAQITFALKYEGINLLFFKKLFESIDYTINKIIPEEVRYLQNFDEMKEWLDDRFQMPDKMVATLIRFLQQNNGKLSKRAREKEFAALTDDEIKEIVENYLIYFKI